MRPKVLLFASALDASLQRFTTRPTPQLITRTSCRLRGYCGRAYFYAMQFIDGCRYGLHSRSRKPSPNTATPAPTVLLTKRRRSAPGDGRRAGRFTERSRRRPISDGGRLGVQAAEREQPTGSAWIHRDMASQSLVDRMALWVADFGLAPDSGDAAT